MTGPGLYDPTNIMNSDTLSKAMKEGKILIELTSNDITDCETILDYRLDKVGHLFIVIFLLSLWVSSIKKSHRKSNIQ